MERGAQSAPPLLDARQLGFGGVQQCVALAGALAGEQGIGAHHQPLARIIRAGDLGQIALVEQRELQAPVGGGERLDGRGAQRGEPVEPGRDQILAQPRLGDHAAIADQDHTPRTPAGEIDRPCRFSISETRTWPQAGCSTAIATTACSISGAVRFFNTGLRRLPELGSDDLLFLGQFRSPVPRCRRAGSWLQIVVRTAPRPRRPLRKPTTLVRLSSSYYSRSTPTARLTSARRRRTLGSVCAELSLLQQRKLPKGMPTKAQEMTAP